MTGLNSDSMPQATFQYGSHHFSASPRPSQSIVGGWTQDTPGTHTEDFTEPSSAKHVSLDISLYGLVSAAK